MSRREPTQGTPPQSAVERIAGTLRERALAAEAGDSLGSEEELSKEFGVSKPTLRQAARLLQYEEILQVRRGVHGGYFAMRPKLDMIARLAGIHLRANGVDIDSVDEVLEALAPLTIAAVLRSGKTQLFLPYTVESATDPKDLTTEDMIRMEGGFSLLLFELTGNPALRLIYSIFFQVGYTVPRRKGPQPGRAEVVRLRIALAKALVARNAAQASALFLEHRLLIKRGLRHDMARADKTKSRKIKT